MDRRAFLAAFGLASVASTASALPLGNELCRGHDKPLLLTRKLRGAEWDDLRKWPDHEQDEDFNPHELRDAMAIVAKYGALGIILPDEVVESMPAVNRHARLHVDQSGALQTYKASEVHIKALRT